MAFISCNFFAKKMSEFEKWILNLESKIESANEGVQYQLRNCANEELLRDTQVPTCEEMNNAIDDKVSESIKTTKTYVDEKIKGVSGGDFVKVFKEKVRTLVKNTGWVLNETENGDLQLSLPKCRKKIKTVSAPYTIADDDEVLLVQNGGEITVPFNTGLEEGREVLIIQTGSEQVSFVTNQRVTLIAPFEGSLKLAGQNAAVSLLGVGSHSVRVLGQTAEG